jgi:hypothetical protein
MGGGELAEAETMHFPRLPASGRFECKKAGEDHSERWMKERMVDGGYVGYEFILRRTLEGKNENEDDDDDEDEGEG